MAKKLFIAEKPSVAQEFAKALKYQMSRRDGYLESEEAIVTWCVGHLVTMSYPEVYDIKYKKWSVDTLPFIPETFKYEVISGVKKQFDIVSSLLNRPDSIQFTSVQTPGERESIFTDLWSRKRTFTEKSAAGSGLILRRRKRFCVGCGRQRICRNMIIWRTQLTCAPRKII